MNEIEKPPEYYKSLWKEKFEKGKFIEVIEIISDLSRLYPEAREHLYEIIDCCNEGLNLFPEDMELHYLLAMCFVHLKKYDSADIVAKKALRLNPKYVKFYNLLGYLSIADFEKETAINIYKKLMELVPEEENNASYNIGFSHFFYGQIEEAKKIWKDLLIKYPEDKRILYSLDLLEKNEEK
ncbi:MAG TPA: tetratricopeptide repeat protein [Candidatus Eremiobacteraeota bacterium]|nr:MAG: Tetratricopeptide repeat protein [bacterium ADurb.Bin363]HPZ07419.1 tetratricopeptide repeat protein [Candidatus Eremiobacteraeota bacterium]